MIFKRIPEELLQKAQKLLFITNIGVGDYTYLQVYLKAFSQTYPHIKIDLWIDDINRGSCWWQWEHVKNTALYEWLAVTPFINKVYQETCSSTVYKDAVKQAQAEQYPLVVSLATKKVASYVALARRIAPYGFVASCKPMFKKYQFLDKRKMYVSKGDCFIEFQPTFTQETLKTKPISDQYAWWFEQLFDLKLSVQDQQPSIAIPKEWVIASKLKLMKHGIDKKTKPFGKVYFVNAYAESEKKAWKAEKAIELIRNLKQDDMFNDVTFLLHVPPERYDKVCTSIEKQLPNNVILFSARDNFFQLPATLAVCDLVISVDAGIVHLAGAVKAPVVALDNDSALDAVAQKVKDIY